MVQDDEYYIKIGYWYARQLKELDLEEEEKQRLLAIRAEVKRLCEQADKAKEKAKKTNRKAKEIHYLIEHFHDHDDDRFEETDHGTVIMNIYGDNIPPEIRRLIEDDRISPEEFKKMDIVHKTKRL